MKVCCTFAKLPSPISSARLRLKVLLKRADLISISLGSAYRDEKDIKIENKNQANTSIIQGLPLRADSGSWPLRSNGVSDPHIIVPSLDGDVIGLMRERPVEAWNWRSQKGRKKEGVVRKNIEEMKLMTMKKKAAVAILQIRLQHGKIDSLKAYTNTCKI